MPKFGRGLNREIVSAVNQSYIQEPFSISDIRIFVKQKRWDVTESYCNVCLSNGTSQKHSHTYKKYFISLGDGKYVVNPEYKGEHWK